ncbi:MAG: NAD(P)-dependent glycerol-3-phosphate dehydrogenase [Inquilinus sp.]|nr:NAD(P)-dependent glycerol-3-phosphate dehydrogenase [Inquilinus sp.]
MTALRRIGVLGAGAWGTALAQAACRAGRDVVLWARNGDLVETIRSRGENPDYLPGIALDPKLQATTDLAAAASADALLLVTPAQHLRAICARLGDPRVPLIVCAKGFETATGALMSEVVAAECPRAPIAILSGPSFAAEVAKGLPTAVTLACADEALGRSLVEALGGRSFRPYWSDDVVGAQIGGAVKNVLAIAAGAVMGRRLGDNARAALVTRGLAELMRLGEALGARRETLMGLSGLGDLMLTCTSLESRNCSLGFALAEGRTLNDILSGRRSVTEGVHTAAAVVRLAGEHGVEAPISTAVDAVLRGEAGIDESVMALMDRPFKAERH